MPSTRKSATCLATDAQRTSVSDPICQHGNMHRTSTVFLQVYNVTAKRRI
jgi:hypothetical protein